jgi:hypothetical protein
MESARSYTRRVSTSSTRPGLTPRSPRRSSLTATLTFGAVQSFVSTRLLAGRQRTSDVKVRAEVAGRRAPTLGFGFLAGLGGVTVTVALLAYADGAGHPATMASVLVAVAILLGGPRLMAAIRAGAIRRAAAG